MNTFRTLRADEIDCRVATINEKGLTLLLYKDARVDQNILDETFGIFGWKRTHQLIGDRLYCTVEVQNPDTGEWIPKQDVGTESYTEKEKGQASDSFKRACFNLGIGRELYTAPFIWVSAKDYESKQKNGKPTTYDRFRVSRIEYKDGSIVGLDIVNDSRGGKVVWSLGTQKSPLTHENPAEDISPTDEKKAVRKELVAFCNANAIDMREISSVYGLTKDSSAEELGKVLNSLKLKYA